MTTMIPEVYDAFMSAGADEEKARKAAEAVAEHEKRFDHIDKELLLLKWMMGVMLAGIVSLVLKVFFV
ncbi:MAG: integrase [Gammaproteobacteria bacterium]|nr:MAG: integrase [Gammaproteobacteria bacterium]